MYFQYYFMIRFYTYQKCYLNLDHVTEENYLAPKGCIKNSDSRGLLPCNITLFRKHMFSFTYVQLGGTHIIGMYHLFSTCDLFCVTSD